MQSYERDRINTSPVILSPYPVAMLGIGYFDATVISAFTAQANSFSNK